MIDTSLSQKSCSTNNKLSNSILASRNYNGNSHYMRKDDHQISTPRILLKNSTHNNSTIHAVTRNENMPPISSGNKTANSGSYQQGKGKYDANSSNTKQSSNIFSSSLSEFHKCSECDSVRRTSLDEWLNHLGANHPVPSSWPSDRASSLDEAKQPHPYTSVVDSHKKRKNDSIPRPLNSFMIFAQYIRRLVLHSFPDAHNVHISQRIGELWRNMPAMLQSSFREEASKLAELHAIEFPHYRYQPKKRNRSDSLIQSLPFSVNKQAANNNENHHHQHHQENGGPTNSSVGRSWYYPSENASKWFVDKQLAQQQQQAYNKAPSALFAKRPNYSTNQNTEKLSSNPSILNHNRRPRILIYKNTIQSNNTTSTLLTSSQGLGDSLGTRTTRSGNEQLLIERKLLADENSQLNNGGGNKVANFDAPLTALVSTGNNNGGGNNTGSGRKKKNQESNQNLRQSLQINTNSQDSFSSKSTQDYLNNYTIDFAPTMLTTSPPEVFMDDSNHFLNSYNFKTEMSDFGKEDLGVEDYHSHQPTGSSSTIECESLTDTFMMKEDVLSPLQSPYENQNSCFSDIDLLESSNLNEIPKANLFSMKIEDGY